MESKREIKEKILERIRAYDKILLARHIRPDGDAIGSTHGLACLLRAAFPEKTILTVGEGSSREVAFLGPDVADPDDAFCREALALVLDSGSLDRIDFPKLGLCPELIRIDHHVVAQPYGDLAWIEDGRSSVSEMIADFQQTFPELFPLTKEAALPLFTGIVTDSGRFRFSSTGPDTLRLAARLLETGLDTERLYAELYLEDYDYFNFQAYIYDHMQRTESGVAWLYVDKAMQERFGLDREQASNTVNFMDSIRGSLIWLAFIDNEDGTIRVRLRSRFVTVRELASRYHGGGHEQASGATVYSREEMLRLVEDADALCRAYKDTHDDWL